jgi:hypothetical protein
MQPERLKNWRQLCLNSLEGINQVNWAIPPKYLKTEIPSRDAVFCRQTNKFLQGHLGRSIKEIGDLDLSRWANLFGF